MYKDLDIVEFPNLDKCEGLKCLLKFSSQLRGKLLEILPCFQVMDMNKYYFSTIYFSYLFKIAK